MASISDDVKLRFGMLCGVMAVVLFVGAIVGFLSGHDTYEIVDLGFDGGVMGWYAMILSMVLAGVALTLGFMIRNK